MEKAEREKLINNVSPGFSFKFSSKVSLLKPWKFFSIQMKLLKVLRQSIARNFYELVNDILWESFTLFTTKVCNKLLKRLAKSLWN